MLVVNDFKFGQSYFPNQEVNYKKVPVSDDTNIIELYFEDTGDIASLHMAVAYIKDELKRRNVKFDTTSLILYMPYLPYSAMDREIGNQLFSLKLFAKQLNSMGFCQISVLDLHNIEVAEKYIKNLDHIPVNKYTDQAIADFKPDVLFFPDRGAKRKYPGIMNTHGLPFAYGNKVRDLEGKGRIIEYSIIQGDVELKDKRVLIVDDICRRGGTFILAANKLKKLGASAIALYVSHCEAGLITGGILNDDSPISRVYTTDSQPALVKQDWRGKFGKVYVMKT